MAYSARPIPAPFRSGEGESSAALAPIQSASTRCSAGCGVPLPAGEGQGEGERDVANRNGRKSSASSARPFPRVSGLCSPKTNFPTRFKNDRRKQVGALVFRALLPPHPSPLPWGEGENEAPPAPRAFVAYAADSPVIAQTVAPAGFWRPDLRRR